jgi:hypothetical protein
VSLATAEAAQTTMIVYREIFMKQTQPSSRFAFQFFFISMLVAASTSSADPAATSCERGLQVLAEQAHSKQEVFIAVSDRVASDAAGGHQPTIELRWTAFAEEFVVSLKNSPHVEQGHSTDPGSPYRETFSGDWQGHKAELVLFWRWPSGAWEGDLKQGTRLYSIRVPCEQRVAGSSEPKPSIFYIDYPVEPEA